MSFYQSNAILSYTSQTTTENGCDPITGEVLYINSATIETVKVSIEQTETKSTVNNNDGKDITGVYCTGRFIDPKIAPDWYTGDMMLDICFNNETAKFYTLPEVKSRFGLESCFGSAIKGILWV